MRTAIASALVLAGSAFMFTAALGVVRFPDVFTRMQATTKAATLGVVGVMGAVAVALDHGPSTVRALLVAGFFLLTAPVAAHAIARSAYARSTRDAGEEPAKRSGHERPRATEPSRARPEELGRAERGGADRGEPAPPHP